MLLNLPPTHDTMVEPDNFPPASEDPLRFIAVVVRKILETAPQRQPPDQLLSLKNLARTDSTEYYGMARILRCLCILASSGGIEASRSDAHAYLDPNNKVC